MVNSIVFLINIIFLTSFVFAEVPSYLPICGRRNPDLDKCIMKSLETMRPMLAEGIPEFDIPPLEPLFLPQGLPFSASADLKASAKNVKIWNVSGFKASDLHLDLEKKELSFKVYYDRLKVEGDYEIDAKLFIPIHGNGVINIETYDVYSNINLRYKLINTKKGRQFYFTSMSCKLSVGDYKSEFSATDTPSATLSDAINSVINANRQEILENIIPSLEAAVARTAIETFNSIIKNITYDELLPDHE